MATDARPVTGLDPHSPEFAADGLEIESDLRARCPVSWTDAHGGFWAVASHRGITGSLRDRGLCSSVKTVSADGHAQGGLSIPAPPSPPLIPDELDPPEWDHYRKLLNPPFAPAAIAALRPRISAFTTEAINSVIESGRADLVLDIAGPVTALITLDILGLPLQDWHFYAGPIHRITYDQLSDEVIAGIADIYARLAEVIQDGKKKPQGGLVDTIIAARIDGKPIPDDRLTAILFQLLLGGFDTTGALLANAFWYLEEHRDVHDRLINDDAFLRKATEEFVRWVSPVIALGRTAKREFTVEGQAIQPGERLWMMYRSANRDSGVFDHPDEVDLERFPNRHLGFGTGIHRCLGSNLARGVFEIVLRQVLIRMPDFRIDRPNSHRIPDHAHTNGWIDMPAHFTPGARIPSGIDLDVLSSSDGNLGSAGYRG
jgi:cytochrome P450